MTPNRSWSKLPEMAQICKLRTCIYRNMHSLIGRTSSYNRRISFFPPCFNLKLDSWIENYHMFCGWTRQNRSSHIAHIKSLFQFPKQCHLFEWWNFENLSCLNSELLSAKFKWIHDKNLLYEKKKHKLNSRKIKTLKTHNFCKMYERTKNSFFYLNSCMILQSSEKEIFFTTLFPFGSDSMLMKK